MEDGAVKDCIFIKRFLEPHNKLDNVVDDGTLLFIFFRNIMEPFWLLAGKLNLKDDLALFLLSKQHILYLGDIIMINWNPF